MEKKKAVCTGILGLIALVSVLMLSGCSEEETMEKQGKLTVQVIKEDATEKNTCPKQGMLQSDLSYCADLCAHDREDIVEKCEVYCEELEDIDYRNNWNQVSKAIEKYRCRICGDCTEKQLNLMDDDDCKTCTEEQLEVWKRWKG